MAASQSHTDEKVLHGSSPIQTFSTDYDCEAAAGDAGSNSQRWRKYLSLWKTGSSPEATETTTLQLEECPEGYPRLAAFLSSEPSFSLYRGFSYLHARVLLCLQDQLAVLERELDRKDHYDEGTRSSLLKSRAKDERASTPEMAGRPRQQILNDIREKLVEYDEMLVKARGMAALPKPSKRDYSSVRHWFVGNHPVVQKEQEFIRRKEDIVTLHSGREWCGFDGLVEALLLLCDCKLVRWIFLTPELRAKTRDDQVRYFDRKRVDVLVGLVITNIIFVLLVLPVVAMYKLTACNPESDGTFSAIGVLVVFTLLFSATMCLLTKARRHELFAASAAYCAVLVVFISNVSNTKSG